MKLFFSLSLFFSVFIYTFKKQKLRIYPLYIKYNPIQYIITAVPNILTYKYIDQTKTKD